MDVYSLIIDYVVIIMNGKWGDYEYNDGVEINVYFLCSRVASIMTADAVHEQVSSACGFATFT